MITHYPLLSARPHDINHLDALVEGFSGIVPADKGFMDACRQAQLAQRQAVKVITPQPVNMKESSHSPRLMKASAYWRKLIETVWSHLTERFAVGRIRVHNLWHYQHRLIRKVLAHDDEHILREFKLAAQHLQRRIELFCSLPIQKLDRLKLEKLTKDIGKS